jgi:hypothetical protein
MVEMFMQDAPVADSLNVSAGGSMAGTARGGWSLSVVVAIAVCAVAVLFMVVAQALFTGQEFAQLLLPR